MKRFAVVAVAAATALSLSAGTASGQIAPDTFIQENDVVANDFYEWYADHLDSDSIRKDPTSSFLLVDDAESYAKEKSSEEAHTSTVSTGWNIIGSSMKKDVENGDPLGTGLDTLIALGGLLTLGGVLYGIALQAGVPLPYISPE